MRPRPPLYLALNREYQVTLGPVLPVLDNSQTAASSCRYVLVLNQSTENCSLTGSESMAYLGTFPWSIEDLTVSYSGKDMFTSSNHAVRTVPSGISIMQDVLHSVKAEYSNVKKAHFWQDNAGCYHSSATILAYPVVSSFYSHM